MLDLSNNKVDAVAALAPLAALPELSALDLAGCPIAAGAGGEAAYRAAVYAALPQLTWLDKRNKELVEGCARADELWAAMLHLRLRCSCADAASRRGCREESEDDDEESDEEEEARLRALRCAAAALLLAIQR